MVLVTGATGLIGSHLTWQLLQQGKQVAALKRPDSPIKNINEVFSTYTQQPQLFLDKIKWVEGDISDIFTLIDAMQGIEEVYHCAGLVSFDKKDEKRLLKVNTEGTANMINAALECGVKKFCHVSSVATMPNHDNKKVIDEGLYWKASPVNSYYAISKYGAEREAWRGVEEGLKVVIVNPSVVLGAGCWGQSSSRLVDECYKGIKVYPNGITGYVDVRDVVKSMIALMENNKFGNRYLVSAENLEFKTVFDLFHAKFNRAPAKYLVGKTGLKIGRWFDAVYSSFTKKERRLTKDIVRAAQDKSFFSNEKIKKETNIEFVTIKNSIEHVAECYLKYKNQN